jgi:ribosomal protein L7/L12
VRLMTGLDLMHAKELVEKMAKGDAVDFPAKKK